MDITKKLAEFVCGTNYNDISSDTVIYAKSLCLSCLGMAVAGSTLPPGQALIEYVRGLGAHPEAGVLGAGFRTSVEYAALANATLAHTTELEDDSFPEGIYTANLIPAVFSLGEKLNLSGKAILEAFVLGYEVQSRLGMACIAAFERGWITACAVGSLGVAAAAAKMLKLSVRETTMALSLAASQASGLSRQTATGAHLVEAGFAARNGLVAAMLAKHGLTGNPNIIEGPRGLCDALAGRAEHELEAMTGRLGKPFRIMEVGIKRYPCCYLLQRIIDGVLGLIEEYHIPPDNVENVEVDVNSMFPEIIRIPEPADGGEAVFSLPHSIAAAFLDEKVSLGSFSDEKVRDPRFKEMRQKVKMIVHPDWERGFVAGVNLVTIRLKNGLEYKKTCTTSRGDPPNLLGADEVMKKYTDCAGLVLPHDKVQRAASLVLALEELHDVSEVISILTS